MSTAAGARELIDAAPVSRFQVRVVAICLLLSVIDGFDILVMAFAATPVAKEWGLNGSVVGLLLSAGLVGMALGSALLSPLADRVGRRPLTVLSLVLATTGMALGALAADALQLGLLRLVTGIGVGGLVAGLPVMVAEFTPLRRRGTVIAIYATGLPLGGVLGGLVATAAISGIGWRGTFLVGAALTAVMLLVVLALLPESIDYLALQRTHAALRRTNSTLRKMNLQTMTAFPPTEATPVGRVAAVLSRPILQRTLLLWLAMFLLMAGFYFAASWLPRLIGQSDPALAANAGLLLNVGGVVACLLFAGAALRASSGRLAVGTLITTGIASALTGLLADHVVLLLIVTFILGMAMNASGAGLYALAPTLYPAAARTTAVGWASAVGRIGAIASPVLVGLLVDAGWTAGPLFVLFAPPLIVAGLAVLLILRSSAPEHGSPDPGTGIKTTASTDTGA